MNVSSPLNPHFPTPVHIYTCYPVTTLQTRLLFLRMTDTRWQAVHHPVQMTSSTVDRPSSRQYTADTLFHDSPTASMRSFTSQTETHSIKNGVVCGMEVDVVYMLWTASPTARSCWIGRNLIQVILVIYPWLNWAARECSEDSAQTYCTHSPFSLSYTAAYGWASSLLPKRMKRVKEREKDAWLEREREIGMASFECIRVQRQLF